MKNLNLQNFDEIFDEYVLSAEEMISVKGGDNGEPIVLPSNIPVRI